MTSSNSGAAIANDPAMVAALAAVEALPPEVDEHDAIDVAHTYYGESVTATPLLGERDKNFLLTTDTGSRFVLKFASKLDSDDLLDFQVRALRHVERIAPALALPRVRLTNDGELLCRAVIRGRDVRVRAVTYLDGQPMLRSARTPAQAAMLGAFLAELDRALVDFQHAGDCQPLIWDLQRTLALQPLVAHISDPRARQLVSDVLHEFDSTVANELPMLRSQVIHNDANPGNILVSEHGIAGIIDFGDMLRAPLVAELAIAGAYLRVFDDDPLRDIAALVGGYHEVTTLQPRELDTLHTLIKARLATTVTLLYWRASLREASDSYLREALEQESDAIDFLARLAAIANADAATVYRDACG